LIGPTAISCGELPGTAKERLSPFYLPVKSRTRKEQELNPDRSNSPAIRTQRLTLIRLHLLGARIRIAPIQCRF
jgi:hypothetical protein